VVTTHDIELFTEMTGDRNPLHYDEERARASRFGGIIVFLHVDWSFTAPVHPGDEITAEVEVLEARADKPISRLRTTITNQEGTTVLDGTALVWTEPL
jgi:acyl dehydratase